MCRLNPKITSAAICSHRLATKLISNTISAPRSLGSLKQACIIRVSREKWRRYSTNGHGELRILYLSRLCEETQTTMKPAAGNVSMASSLLKASIKGQCTVDLNLLGEWYPDVKLSVLPNLCSDIILGKDFMSTFHRIFLHSGALRKIL